MKKTESEKITFTENGTIDSDQAKAFKKKLDKLNRRLAKKNMPTVMAAYGEAVSTEIGLGRKDIFGKEMIIIVHTIPVSMTWAAELVISGFKLVATLEKVEGENGSVIFANCVPGEELKSRPEKLVCDHCGHKRARKYGYLLEEVKTGSRIMVGKQCLADFLGHDPAMIIEAARFRFPETTSGSDDYNEGGFSSGRFDFDLSDFLAVTFGCIDRFGYVSKGAAMKTIYDDIPKTATVHHNSHYYFADHKIQDDRDFCKDIETRIKKHIHKVPEVIAHFEKKIESANLNRNSYLMNIDNLLKLGSVPHKYTAFAVSMVGVWLNDMAKLEQEKVEAKNQKASEHQGELKERLRGLELTTVKTHSFENEWGMRTVYTFADEAGNFFKWFSSSAHYIERGEEVKLDGTVKKHLTDSYMRNAKVTELTRCKIKA